MMKKLLFLLCMTFMSSFAYAYNDVLVENKTSCEIVVSSICSDDNCNIIPCGKVYIIPPGAAVICSYCPCEARGFEICWSNPDPSCTGYCIFISDATPCIPASTILPECINCSGSIPGVGASMDFVTPTHLVIE